MSFDDAILSRLGEASAVELTAALATIRAAAAEYRDGTVTQESAAAVQALTDAARAITTEITGRAELAATHTASLADLDSLTAPEAGDDSDTTPETAPAPADEAPAPVTAAGPRPLGTGRPPAVTPETTRTGLPQATVSLRAGANLPDVAAGSPLNRATLRQVFASTARAASRMSGAGKFTVASRITSYPESRTVSKSSAEISQDRIDAALRTARVPAPRHEGATGNALVAAGLCAPLEVLYDVDVTGVDNRPVRDALLRFGAERGGITYRPDINGVAQTGGIGFWTEANDEADPLVAKTCAEIACPGVVTAQVEAIYKCLTHSNMSTTFDPEHFEAVLRAQDVAHARTAENRLLSTITTASLDVYSAKLLGATRDILSVADHMIAWFRSFYRLDDNVPLRWVLPMWAREMMRNDIARQMVGDGLVTLAVTNAMIADWFSARNINVTWHLDGIDPADITPPTPDIVVPNQQYGALTDGSLIPGYPDAISSLMWIEGDWLFLDGGQLDLGIVRDSTLNGTNRFQTFSESFEFAAFRGVPNSSLQVVMQVQPTGQSAATVDTSAVVD